MLSALMGHQFMKGQTLIAMVRSSDDIGWGFINIKGETILPNVYLNCDAFSKEGLAAVYDKDITDFYFIDTKGNRLPVEAKGFRLKTAGLNSPIGFSNGFALYSVGKKWGYLDKSGKIAVEAKFDKAWEFYDDYAVAQSGLTFVILNKELQETPVTDNSIIDVKHFSEGLAPYVTPDKLTGFIDPSAKIAISARFQSVGYFSGGLAWAKTINKLVGYIDKTGNWVIEPRFETGKNFDPETGLARIGIDGRTAFVNRNGEVIYFETGEDFGDFSNGLCWCRNNDLVGFINPKGEWVITPRFEAVREFKNGYAAVKEGDEWGFIDTKGNWVIKPVYSAVKDMELVSE